jgi:hypothetical protein
LGELGKAVRSREFFGAEQIFRFLCSWREDIPTKNFLSNIFLPKQEMRIKKNQRKKPENFRIVKKNDFPEKLPDKKTVQSTSMIETET